MAINPTGFHVSFGKRELEAEPDDYLRAGYPRIPSASRPRVLRRTSSMSSAYGKGARTLERNYRYRSDGAAVPLLSLPEQADTWFKAFQKPRDVRRAGLAKAHPARPRKSSI